MPDAQQRQYFFFSAQRRLQGRDCATQPLVLGREHGQLLLAGIEGARHLKVDLGTVGLMTPEFFLTVAEVDWSMGLSVKNGSPAPVNSQAGLVAVKTCSIFSRTSELGLVPLSK
jgi:hypothetical protein